MRKVYGLIGLFVVCVALAIAPLACGGDDGDGTDGGDADRPSNMTAG
jgi:hypothetical protein